MSPPGTERKCRRPAVTTALESPFRQCPFVGTCRTCRSKRTMSADRGKAEFAGCAFESMRGRKQQPTFPRRFESMRLVRLRSATPTDPCYFRRAGNAAIFRSPSHSSKGWMLTNRSTRDLADASSPPAIATRPITRRVDSAAPSSDCLPPSACSPSHP